LDCVWALAAPPGYPDGTARQRLSTARAVRLVLLAVQHTDIAGAGAALRIGPPENICPRVQNAPAELSIDWTCAFKPKAFKGALAYA